MLATKPFRGEVVLAARARGEHLVVEVHLGQAGHQPEDDVLDGGPAGGGHGDGVAVAARALGDPEDVYLVEPRAFAGGFGFLADLGGDACGAHVLGLPRRRSRSRSRVAAAGAGGVGSGGWPGACGRGRAGAVRSSGCPAVPGVAPLPRGRGLPPPAGRTPATSAEPAPGLSTMSLSPPRAATSPCVRVPTPALTLAPGRRSRPLSAALE